MTSITVGRRIIVFRSTLILLTVGMPFCLVASADDSKGEKSKGNKGIIATYVKADVAKSTITVETTDKSGKTIKMELALDKNAKVLGSDDKPESLADFAKSMDSRKDKSIIIVEDKENKHILEIKDIPKKI